MTQDYFIGLDIGTESVGWAVTDPEYRLCKCSGKAMWGVRLFEAAQPAEQRRMHRTARRRLERRHQRIAWLQEMFSEEIAKKDPAFFQRLQESKFLEEDKRADHPLGRYTLFADHDYNDKDYHKQYPTIYHLRQALMEEEGPFDVRLVYLAVHHILKYRGHFLFGELSMDSVTLESGLDQLNEYLEEIWETKLSFTNLKEVEHILKSGRLGVTRKRKLLLAQMLPDEDHPQLAAIIDLLAGKKVSLSALYGEEIQSEEISAVSMKKDFEEEEDKLFAALGERIELILRIKAIYDWALLEEIRGGKDHISDAKVEVYQKHKDDLARLKAAVRKTGDSKLYREIFRKADGKTDNYPAYSGKNTANHRCDYDQFKKFLSGKMKPYAAAHPEVAEICEELEMGGFLPKQTTKDNGVIPHQLHEAELEIILRRAGSYLSFLEERDESGLTLRERMMEMFRFRVPYYVGPLASGSPHSWIERKEGRIYPWNFSRMVDLETCAERFITRMTAKCSYIGEDVLPKDSLLYSKFMVLNELNNLKLNGKKLPVSVKQDIYRDLFLSGRKVTLKKVEKYLNAEGLMEQGDELSGVDGDFKSTLSSHSRWGWLLSRPGGEAAAEDIIRHIVLFGEDRKLLAGWVEKTYGELLTPEEQKRACTMKFSGWGRLSGAFLTRIYHGDPETGEARSVLDMLWETNDNLMELLSGRYSFGESVQAWREEKNRERSMTLDEYLKESYASPAIRRSIHQVIRIISEIEKIMKAPPKKVFVEVAREEGKKGVRTVSRKGQLMELYRKCAEETDSLFASLEGRSEGDLRRDKLYLYYTQLGRCMYSREPIDLERLDVDYDIDHIYPQSVTKDDSLRNRVLVKRQLNAKKSDQYPLDGEIREKMRPFWSMLRKNGLIDQEKYDRLTRVQPLSQDELAGFIARQLVETRQSSKLVAELLRARYGDVAEVVYVKAGHVSSFRQDQRIDAEGRQKQAGQCGRGETTVQDPLFVKCREINDHHHAKDAYLNIVAGNVYHVKFTRDPRNFLKEKNVKYSLNRMFDFDVRRGGETAWIAGEEGSIQTVRRMMRKNNVLHTRMAFKAGGGLFDQMIRAKGSGQAAIKSSDSRMDIEKYGGYNKVTGAYFCLVEHTEKKKRVRSLETVLLMHEERYRQDPEAYCREVLELQSPVILIPEIKINTMMEYDGFRMHLSGRTGRQIIYKNANQLVLDPIWNRYIKGLGKYQQRCAGARTVLPVTVFDGISREENETLYGVLLSKLENSRYSVKLGTAAGTVRDGRKKFCGLELHIQVQILLQLLNLFANNAASADLKQLCGKAGIGILLTSKNLKNYDGHSFKLIHQSVTGIFEQEVDLLTVGKA